GRALDVALRDDDLPLRIVALRAAGELGRSTSLAAVLSNLAHEDASCRLAAAWSAALLAAEPRAVSELLLTALLGVPQSDEALDLAIRRQPPATVRRWLDQLSADLPSQRTALRGYGVLGDLSGVPRLLEAMKNPTLARRAGESFTFITGCEFTSPPLRGQMPEKFEAGPTDEAADDDVAPDPDENLPWPDSAAVAKWWDAHRTEFAAGTRHLLGKPITPEWCREVLKIGKQRQRAAAALELAIRQPGRPLFDVTAPAHRQVLTPA